MRAFLYGAIVGSTLALVLNLMFDTAAYSYGLGVGVSAGLLTAVVIAPLVEEAAKAGGLGLQRKRIRELEDGLIYGAAIGLGFAAAENMVYGASAWLDNGTDLAVKTVLLRAVSSTVMHGGVSALIGFGYSRAVLNHGFGAGQLIPYYLIAVLIHGTYNVLVSLESTVGLVIAIIMVWAVLTRVNHIIGTHDAMPHQRL
jgi:RsiW-degrading membrane proteinase PrsW (M82 family)